MRSRCSPAACRRVLSGMAAAMLAVLAWGCSGSPTILVVGGVRVTIFPLGAAAATWTLDGGTAQVNGATVSNVAPGPHVVHFNDVLGYTTPPDQTPVVTAGATANVTGTYTELPATGAVMVTIEPAGAAAGTWTLDGGAAQANGATVSNVAPGPHTVHFNDVLGYGTPADQTPTVTAGQTTNVTGTYGVGPVPAPGSFLTEWGTGGNAAGQFDGPYGIATDAQGRVYVTDFGNDRFQQFDAFGTFLAQSGSEGAAPGQFQSPEGIAVDDVGDLYISEWVGNRLQKLTAAGAPLLQWGSTGPAPGQFDNPLGVAVDAQHNVFVADNFNNRIEVFDATGAFVRQWGTPGAGVGQFDSPAHVALDALGNVYVADSDNGRIQVFTPTGAPVAQWSPAGLGTPTGVAVDALGNVYVVDQGNRHVLKLDSTGAILAQWGTSGAGPGQFIGPFAVAVDTFGNVYVTDVFNQRVLKFQG